MVQWLVWLAVILDVRAVGELVAQNCGLTTNILFDAINPGMS